MKKLDIDHQVVVIGGGMIGAAAALALAQAGWRVALVEQQRPATFAATQEPDLRVSALSYRSVQTLKQLNAWTAIQSMRVTPYRRLETREWQCSTVSFDATTLGLSELGFIVENRLVQLGLWQQCVQHSNLTLYCPDSLHSMQKSKTGWDLILETGKRLSTSLVIGADGAESKVRDFAHIGVTGWQYKQSCLLITIKTQQPAQAITWQKFCPSGPKAFLPLYDHYASLVWYDSPQRIRQLSALSLIDLKRQVMQHFPVVIGELEVLEAGAFGLTRRHAQSYVADGVVLIGDAAHTIHPLAGQGVNLGYRDIDVLLLVLNKARDNGESIYDEAVLRRYQSGRRADNLLMQTGMDLFHFGFSNSLLPLAILRNITLMAIERAEPIKKQALKYALGL